MKLWMFVLFSALAGLVPVLAQAQVETLWVRRYDGPARWIDAAADLVVDAQGNCYVTGTVSRTMSDFDICTIKYGPGGETLWVAHYDDPGHRDNIAHALAVDRAGNVYVTGSSPLDLQDSVARMITIRYSPEGIERWVAFLGGEGALDDWGADIAVDSSGAVCVAGTVWHGDSAGYDFALARYDSSGLRLWVQFLDGPNRADDVVRAMTVSQGQDLLVAGSCTAGGLDRDFLVAKFSSAGEPRWSAIWGTTGDDEVADLAVDAQGNAIATGSCGLELLPDYATVKFDSSGNRRWAVRYDGPLHGADEARALVLTDQGEVLVTGGSRQSESTATDYVTIKYDTAGHQQWLSVYDGPVGGEDMAYALARDGQGTLYVTGASQQSDTVVGYATIKYDSNGNERWVARYSSLARGSDAPCRVTVDADGHVYVTGKGHANRFSTDFLTIKYHEPAGVAELRGRAEPGLGLGCEPNPIRDQARISFTLASPGDVTLALFDAQGRRVQTIAARRFAAGRHDLLWRAVDRQNEELAPGVYLAVLAAGNDRIDLKLVKTGRAPRP